MIDTASIRGSRDTLIAALTAAGARIRGTAFQCPFHEDSTPPGSGSVFQKDGVWRAHCHAASCGFHGDALDVEARSRGMNVEDVIRERAGQQPRPATSAPSPALAPAAPPDAETKNLRPYPTLEALTLAVGSSPGISHVEDVTPSTNPDTQNVDIVTFRCRTAGGEKTFRIGHQSGGQWYMTAPPKPWPLFNRTRLRATEFVIVVEGEKCMKALVNLSVPVTTGVGGAGKSTHHDWEPLRGKTVYLWPDADAPNPKTGLSGGVEHMKAVAEILQRMECDVHMIDPFAMGLRDGDDVVDWLERNPGTKSHQTDLIDRVLLDAKPLPGASEDLALRLEDCIAGRYATAPWPWTALTRETAALRPGTLTLVCGDPGSTKSFFVLECLLHWTRVGVPASAFELEEDRAYWLHRVLACHVGDGNVTSPEWCREHPDDVRQLYRNNRKLLDQVAARLWASPDDPPTYRAVLEWIEQRATAGDRVIIVDPLTAITTSTDRFLEDLEFMTRAKKIARVHGCSLVFVTHPRKTGKTRSPLEDMAGGAAFPRFSQTVFWLRTERPSARGTVAVSGGKGAASWNRSCIIAKARNAAGGGGGIIAFDFVGSELRFAERGVVLDDEPDND